MGEGKEALAREGRTSEEAILGDWDLFYFGEEEQSLGKGEAQTGGWRLRATSYSARCPRALPSPQ